MDEGKVIHIISSDDWMMEVLLSARSLDLPDWMVGAGFVRNKIWDYFHGYNKPKVDTSDIDLVYYDKSDLSENIEKAYDEHLAKIMDVNWSVKNQARMHYHHKRPHPYKNTKEALSEWVETCTCVAVRLEWNDKVELIAPYGIGDLVSLIVKPTPLYQENLDIFWGRVTQKRWQEKWPKLRVQTVC